MDTSQKHPIIFKADKSQHCIDCGYSMDTPQTTIFDKRPTDRWIDVYTPKTHITDISVNPSQKHRILAVTDTSQIVRLHHNATNTTFYLLELIICCLIRRKRSRFADWKKKCTTPASRVSPRHAHMTKSTCRDALRPSNKPRSRAHTRFDKQWEWTAPVSLPPSVHNIAISHAWIIPVRYMSVTPSLDHSWNMQCNEAGTTAMHERTYSWSTQTAA